MHDSHTTRLLALFLLLGAAHSALAQAPYPARPIRFLVGFPPGGTNDIVARALAPKLSEYLGQSVVIENRGGANTAIATELCGARRAGRLYHLAECSRPCHQPGADEAHRSIRSRISPSSRWPQNRRTCWWCTRRSRRRSVKELIAFSKKHPPGSINYGSSGTGTTVHLSAELFQFMTGVKWLHIPYKGGGPAVIDLLAGQHVIYFGNVPTVILHARAGKLRALAVTGPKRTPAAPEIPTVAESGVPGYEVTTSYGVAAPAKTSRAIIDRLHADIVRALNSPDLRERLQDLGADPVGNTPEQYTAFMQNEIVKWTKVIRAAGIKGE